MACVLPPFSIPGQDADPANNTDCDENSEQGEIVRATELEVFSR